LLLHGNSNPTQIGTFAYFTYTARSKKDMLTSLFWI